MELYQVYFDSGQAGKPYCSEEEAREDAFALVDMHLAAACELKSLWNQRLEMRGIVITPEEFESALYESAWESRRELRRKRLACSQALKRAGAQIQSRVKAGEGGSAQWRIWRAPDACGLTSLETLCYLLAAAVEWDRKYERIYGYVQDNVAAKMPTEGLAVALCDLTDKEESSVRPGRRSPLYRYLLRPDTMEYPAQLSRLSRPLVLRDSALAYLCGGDCLDAIGGEEREGITVFGERLAQRCEEQKMVARDMAGSIAWACRLRGDASCTLVDGGCQEAEQAREVLERENIVCRSKEGPAGIAGCALPVKTVYGWDDLMIEESQLRLMRQLCARVRYQDTVNNQWGFGEKSPYGNGVSALFYGPPGTGKTMAAQVVAKDLGLPLYKVDLSALVSKYIGETEKNIGRLFAEAEKRRAVLLFDEADGLFAKRSQISGSNDRYANMETGYLLQRFEEYDGISILATNCMYHMDDAFKRRIGYVVRFVYPSQETRLKMWKRMIPVKAPIDEELELSYYAMKFELTGSGIRQVVTNAAYLAASGNRGMMNRDIRQALKDYYLKSGKSLSDKELYS